MISRWLSALAPVLRHPRAKLGGLMALAGALAFAVVGNTPAALHASDVADSAWALSPPGAPDLATAQATMATTPLWLSQPAAAPAADAAPPPAPPPRLLGIIRVGSPASRSAMEAVFLMPDGRRQRAAAGATLADGSTVETLADTRATIMMADGRKLELRLLDGPIAQASP